MRSDWKIKKLSEIAIFNPTERLPKGAMAKKIGMDKLQPFCRDIPSYEVEAFSGGTKFRNGDTIMARITPCLENGKTAKVGILDADEIGFGSTEYIVFRPSVQTDEDYLYYLVCSPMVREPAIKSMVGSSGRQRVQTSVVENLEISVPSYEEQKKIGSFLKALDDKIELNNRINENLEQQLRVIFEEWFISEADDTWEEKKIGDFLRLERGLSYKGKYLSDNEGVPMLNLGNILPNSVFRPEKLKFYTGEYKSKVVVSPGDIIVANTDLTQAREVLGSAIRVPSLDYPEVICSHHISIVKDCTISKNFILGLLNMPAYRARVIGFATGTTVLALPNEALLNCTFRLPPDSLIKQYDDLAEAYYSEIELHRQEKDKLETIRDSLLPRLMNGSIDVSEVM